MGAIAAILKHRSEAEQRKLSSQVNAGIAAAIISGSVPVSQTQSANATAKRETHLAGLLLGVFSSGARRVGPPEVTGNRILLLAKIIEDNASLLQSLAFESPTGQ